MSNSSTDTIECGRDAAKHFLFDADYTNLNHGSYGTHPFAIRHVLRDFQERIEARPDAFVRYEYRTNLLDESRRAIATYLDVPVETCVLTVNATTAIEAVLRNLEYQAGDVLIGFSNQYGAFVNTFTHLSQTTPVRIRLIEYTLPISDAYLCDALKATIQEVRASGQNPRLVLFDTINAVPGVRMPFELLVDICRDNDVLSCVDGAHGVGQIPLDLEQLDPDFFTSNLHKWLYVPRGCAVLYVPLRNQHLMRSTFPTSFGFGKDFVSNFAYVGTLDDSPLLCVPAALEWRERVAWKDLRGDPAIMQYMTALARQGGRAVAKILDTEVLENEEQSLSRCALTNVRLPLTAGLDDLAVIAAWVQKTTTLEYNTGVVVVAYAGACWVRLSAQIYLTLDDFKEAGHKLLEICQRAELGEWKK